MAKIDQYELYLSTLDKCNPNERGFLDVDRFNRMLADASNFCFDDLTGIRRQYTQGRPEAITGGFQRTIKITDNLRPFIRRQIIPIGAGRIAPYPEDYAYYVKLRIAYGDLSQKCRECIDELCATVWPDDPTVDIAELIKEKIREIENAARPLVGIDVVDSAKVSERLTSEIPGRRPDHRNPIAEQTDQGFEIIPGDVGNVLLIYLTEPTAGKLVMTFDPEQETEVYDLANTIQTNWPSTMQLSLSQKIADLFSVWVRDVGGLAMGRSANPAAP